MLPKVAVKTLITEAIITLGNNTSIVDTNLELVIRGQL
jgi:hypothetical protein